MTLATYVNYALPVLILLIGGATLLLNTALRKWRSERQAAAAAAPETPIRVRPETQAVVDISTFRKAAG